MAAGMAKVFSKKNVVLWPKCEVTAGLAGVRSWGHNGPDLLRPSSSQFDPERTLICPLSQLSREPLPTAGGQKNANDFLDRVSRRSSRVLLALVNYICPAHEQVIDETYPFGVFARIRHRMQYIAHGIQSGPFLVI